MSQKVDLGNKVMIVDSSSVCYIIHNYYVKIFHDYVNISYKVIKLLRIIYYGFKVYAIVSYHIYIFY